MTGDGVGEGGGVGTDGEVEVGGETSWTTSGETSTMCWALRPRVFPDLVVPELGAASEAAKLDGVFADAVGVGADETGKGLVTGAVNVTDEEPI